MYALLNGTASSTIYPVVIFGVDYQEKESSYTGKTLHCTKYFLGSLLNRAEVVDDVRKMGSMSFIVEAGGCHQ